MINIKNNKGMNDNTLKIMVGMIIRSKSRIGMILTEVIGVLMLT